MMTKKQTEIVSVNPACQCCLREDNLTEKSNGKGLVYWLCDDCVNAGFKWINGVCTLVCPAHGPRHHYDADNVKYFQRFAKKKGYWYDCPVKTRNAKENDKAAQYLLIYDERMPE